MPTLAKESRPAGLLPRVTCPHCWEPTPPQKLLWVSEHTDLLGDHRLGPEQAQRFLPTRFTVNGEALDAKGFPCHQLACPNCHLTIPRSLLETEPLFLSIFGAPASGKSYFLAALTWELRKTLPLNFRVGFADADPVLNQQLNAYEESVFSGSSKDELVPLGNLIRKTEEQGDLYDTVSFGNQSVSYPRPFLFTLQPQPNHRNAHDALKLARTVCLYDNAGESFQPGKDSAAAPVTRHMAQSRVLFFVFDPTQDARFQRLIGKNLAPARPGQPPFQVGDTIVNSKDRHYRDANPANKGSKTFVAQGETAQVVAVDPEETLLKLSGNRLVSIPSGKTEGLTVAHVAAASRSMRQEPILQEAIARIRRFAGLKHSERHKRPLVVILTKFDVWWQLLGSEPSPDPWQMARSPGSSDTFHALDAAAVARQSQLAREVLLQTSPEIVTAAEGFAEDVTYVPVTAVGWNVAVDKRTGLPAIKPSEAAPYWVTVPFLMGLSRSVPGLIPTVNKRG